MNNLKQQLNCEMEQKCNICQFNRQCTRRVALFGKREVSDIAKLAVAYGGQLVGKYSGQHTHARTGELLVTRQGITMVQPKMKPISTNGSPKQSYNRRTNQTVKRGAYTVKPNGEIGQKGVVTHKPTAQWQGIWTMTKRRRIDGGHSWFDSNPNR